MKDQEEPPINVPRPGIPLVPDNAPINMRPNVAKTTKNIVPFFLRKRLSAGGMLWIDRVTEEAAGDYETVKGPEVQNYLWDSHSSSDEKIAQMKSIRYMDIGEYICFDPDDDVNHSAIKNMNTSMNFKNFSKGRKVLKTDSVTMPVS